MADQLLPDEEWAMVPPDGGWGWLVLGGTVLVNMLIPGTIKSFGVLFVEFLEVFDATPMVASWIPALCYFLYCSLGPLASYLSVKLSYRTVTLIGGLFASVGMIISYFANSIVFLYFSYGIMVGIGAGLSFPPGIFIVTSYFVRFRGFANGLAISGSAIGSVILPPFLRLLLENYGYRGAVLIMGGITLNVLVGALLYEPVEKHMKRVKVKKAPPPSTNGHTLQPIQDQKEPDDVEEPAKPADETVVVIKTFSRSQHDAEPLLERLRKDSGPSGWGKSVSSLDRKISIGSSGHLHRKGRVLTKSGNMTRNVSVASNMSSSSFRYVSTAFHGSTLVGLHPEYSSQRSIRKGGSSCWNFFSCKGKPSKEKGESQKSAFPLGKLLRDPLFLVILTSNATSAIGYTNFVILVPAYALNLGFDKAEASYLLSLIAALDLVGRIGGSALSDVLRLDKRVYFIGGFLVSGLSLALVPLTSSYLGVATLCAFFGLSSGIYVGITAVMMVDLLGEQLLASSYGISLFVNGVLQLIGPPICGLIFSHIQHYTPIVCGLGIFLLAGAGVWAVIPFTKRPPS